MENNKCIRCDWQLYVVPRGNLRVMLCRKCDRTSKQNYWRAKKKYPNANISLNDYYLNLHVRLAPKKDLGDRKHSAKVQAAKRMLNIAIRMPK